MQNKVPPSQKQDHVYEQQNPFPLRRNCQNQLSHSNLSPTEQECQENLIQGKIHIQRNSNKGSVLESCVIQSCLVYTL